MTFKEWLAKEDAFQGGSEPGNAIAPEDRGLKRSSTLRPIPKSKLADKMFGMNKKKLRRRNQVASL